MSIRSVLITCAAVLGILSAEGCAAMAPSERSQATTARSSSTQSQPAAVQSAVMGFADRFLSAMAEVYDSLRDATVDPDVRLAAQRFKAQAAQGALGNAVNPNPLVGLMDMAIFVTLTRETAQEPWAAESFGAEGAGLLETALLAQEEDIWRIVGVNLSEAQVAELHALISKWREVHPGARYVAGVRLADLPGTARSDSRDPGLAASVLAIIRLDPFAGLDPALRQVEQSRVLGERVFFYMRHMAVAVSWQAEVLYTEMLAAPQAKRLIADTNQFTQNTGRFADATVEFADAGKQIAGSVERFRAGLPAQQEELIDQLNNLVACRLDEAIGRAGEEFQIQRELALKQVSAEFEVEREAALKQAGEIVSKERAAAIEQLNAMLASQQNTVSGNLQAVLDHSIDRLYSRALTLVLICGGAALVVVVVWQALAAASRKRWAASAPGSATAR